MKKYIKLIDSKGKEVKQNNYVYKLKPNENYKLSIVDKKLLDKEKQKIYLHSLLENENVTKQISLHRKIVFVEH